MQAGVLNINANKAAIFVKVEHDTIRNLITVCTGFFGQMDIERIRFWIV